MHAQREIHHIWNAAGYTLVQLKRRLYDLEKSADKPSTMQYKMSDSDDESDEKKPWMAQEDNLQDLLWQKKRENELLEIQSVSQAVQHAQLLLLLLLFPPPTPLSACF